MSVKPRGVIGPENGLRPITVRVRGLPYVEHLAADIIDRVIRTHSIQAPEYGLTIVPTCDRESELTALVDFPLGIPDFLLPLKTNPQTSQQFLDNEELITFDRHFVGFTQVHQTVKPILADVVAICGIDGHAYGSWQSKESPYPMWLRHFLPKDFPNCRIMTWGYSAKLARLDHATINDYAREFLEALKRIRTGKAQDRPIIFLAHSFGGIVLVRALLQADRIGVPGESLTALLESLLGIMFFAVPHSGMDVEDMSQIMGSVDHPRATLINHIRSDSEQLDAQREAFRDFIYHRQGRSLNCNVISFFETERTPRLQQNENGEWSRCGDLCMPLASNSAVLGLPSQMETCISVHTDHSSIIKFNSRYDEAYGHIHHHFRNLLGLGPKPLSRKPTARVLTGLDPDSPDKTWTSANEPSNATKVLIPVLLISALVTISLPQNNDIAQWIWKQRNWGFWGIAVPIAIYTARNNFLEDTDHSKPQD